LGLRCTRTFHNRFNRPRCPSSAGARHASARLLSFQWCCHSNE
jgi:hypothetical protein